MKRLVLLGEGHGEDTALSILVKRLLRERDGQSRLHADAEVIRSREATSLVTWDKEKRRADYGKWRDRVNLAARRRDLGGVLAVFDGDAKRFPAGSDTPFCAAAAARAMAAEAATTGAGRIFSLAIVFACVEFETWIIAGVESLAGKSFPDGRQALPADTPFPAGDPESHGKGWLEKNCPGYRPTRDQGALTQLMDLNVVRAKRLRSFTRLEHAIDLLLEAAGSGQFIVTPK